MVSTHVGGLVAVILLAVCAPIAAGQTNRKLRQKRSLESRCGCCRRPEGRISPATRKIW